MIKENCLSALCYYRLKSAISLQRSGDDSVLKWSVKTGKTKASTLSFFLFFLSQRFRKNQNISQETFLNVKYTAKVQKNSKIIRDLLEAITSKLTKLSLKTASETINE